MKLLKQYFKLQQEIFEYFGYVEDWKVIPLDDQTDQYWLLKQNKDGQGYVVFYSEPLTQEILDGGLYYCNSIYTQRHLPKWVYRGEEYTLICVDTQTDGNFFLTVFSNNKETSPEGLNVEAWLSNPQ